MSRTRSTLRSVAVLTALMLVSSLTGCAFQKAHAVQTAHAALLAAIQKHDLNKASGVAEVGRELSSLHDEAKAIDISECPDDYQAQFREVVTSLGDVSSTAAALGDNVSPADVETFKAKLTAFQATANQLDEVAKKYITIK